MIAALMALSVVAAPTDIDKLAFMGGCWTLVRPNGTKIEEQWLAPAGGAMIGMSRSVRDGKLREFEFMRIVPGEDGTLRYVAIPSGQAETAFPLKDLAANAVTFENPKNGFPQRILYLLADRDTLVARIEGSVNGQERSADFPYKRCPAGN
ncbi:DUF6265 family protein [Caulobacter vibrioides]|uniref:DUF6265 domain-containing protein n=2 Tax=Caulobacter vibrioides TaxID=155892 RepID=Q9A5I9_CAUVC|nr:DUF6265 family protein [Caulobacter vibrioides]YP_002517915.1 hypothetical protein CCNA_02542 [Caulobacter vibrioides NA1000]AAK24429.1 hypothetical protein CC_2458 [Caulobacter vibrioides CB15]ACL96007.1 hypothetical protein CCNA_02542 [Caulobacter vibrioides NA1000]ATC29311.1 hypothetical protein CA607_13325 [Caulobacter vibrioides]QXZ50823.1 hypothetical protein KZH45_13085 [Caulobacter vibrioides]